VVVVYRSLCQGQFFRYGTGGVDASAPAPAKAPGVQQATSLMLASMGFAMPYGLLMAAAAYALPTRRHMHLYGTTSEQLATSR
jgi:acetyl-CoA acetyltransferase